MLLFLNLLLQVVRPLQVVHMLLLFLNRQLLLLPLFKENRYLLGA
jgi:hypothetical protein